MYNTSKPKTTFLQKIILISFGLLCCVIILEISLRLGGLVFSCLQQCRNYFSIGQEGAYRILCLGESTTANQYPSFLEEALNQRNIGIKFSVIDKGVIGTNTWSILHKLESNLEVYHPDMVITMMGVNDLGPHMPYEAISNSQAINFWRSFRVYKLTRLLWLHIVARFKELTSDKLSKYTAQPKIFLQRDKLQSVYTEEKATELNLQNKKAYIELGRFYRGQMRLSEAEASVKKAIELNPKNDRAYLELGWVYRDQDRDSEAEALFKKAIELNPENDKSYIELGRFYRDRMRLSEAEALFKKAIELNPKNDRAYLELGWFYRDQMRLSEAEASFKKAIELSPKKDIAYLELGWVYRDQDRLPEAEALFKKAVEFNPKNDMAYVELGYFYRDQGKDLEAEALFKKAIELNPKNNKAYVGLGRFYQNHGRISEAETVHKKAVEFNPKNDMAYLELGWFYRNQMRLSEAEASFKKAMELSPKNDRAYFELGLVYRDQDRDSEAEASFKKAIEFNPKNDRAYAALKVLYMEMGNSGLAREYDKKTKELRSSYYVPSVIGNYHELKANLDKRGITYVCVQYPMRSLKPLKRIFNDCNRRIIFVDNEKIFKDAVSKKGYKTYFRDMFSGDFGHCTEKGNRLLAENIANTILKECFNK